MSTSIDTPAPTGLARPVIQLGMDPAPEHTILVLGDIVLEHHVNGTVSDVCSDAPVPVLEESRVETFPAGAANVARNIAALNMPVLLVGLIGTDEEGKEILKAMKEHHVDTRGVLVVQDRRTTLRTHILGNDKRILAIDRVVTSQLSVPMQHELVEFVRRSLDTVDVIVLSDHGKGLSHSTLPEIIIRMANSANKRVVVDYKGVSKLRRYAGATVLLSQLHTLNTIARSLPQNPDIFENGDISDRAIRAARDANRLGVLVVTHGVERVSIYEGSSKTLVPLIHYTIKDERGIEDNFVAGLVWELFRQECSIVRAVRVAGQVRASALAQPGVSVIGFSHMLAVQLREIRHALDTRSRSDPTRKIIPLAELDRTTWWMKELKVCIVLTVGCFDLLHGGHIDFLHKAKELGEKLIVGLRSDASIRRLKGVGRPIVAKNIRAKMLTALACVDYLTVFDELSPLHLIQTLHPSILALGAHQGNVVERGTVEAVGRVAVIPMTSGLSTMALVDSIIERHNF